MFRVPLLMTLGIGLAATAVHAADLPQQTGPAAPYETAHGLLFSGVADIWIGYVWMDDDLGPGDGDEPDDTGRISGQAALNIPFGDRFSAQVDVAGEADFDNSYPSAFVNDYEGLIQAGLHLSYRDPSRFLLGVFGGIGEAYVRNQQDEEGWMIGGEGQFYLGNTTFYGQAGYFDTDGNDPGGETLADAWFVRGVVRHFLTPNSVISGEGLYGEGDNTEITPDDIEFAGWEFRYKRQMQSFPLAWFIGYEGHYIAVDKKPTSTDDEYLFEHIVKVGVSIQFGADDLMKQDRYGVALDLPLEPLRAAGYTADIID